MEKIPNSLLLIVLLAIVGRGTLWAQFGGGNGTASNPWQISSATHLNNVRNYLGTGNSDKFFVQTADIDIGVAPWNQGNGWSPIGCTMEDPHAEYPFSGNYDGDGHVIFGLYINRPYGEAGLFGVTQQANISNLNIAVADVNASSCGMLVGNCQYTSISNCHSSGAVLGGYLAGGLIGVANMTLVSNCSVSGTVSGLYLAGGLVGGFVTSSLSNSYSTANVSSESAAGGLVSGCGSGSISNCYYDYENVLINGGHNITPGALGTDLYNIWMANGMVLSIDNYLSSDETGFLIGSVLDLQYLLAFGQFEEYSYRLTADLDLQGHPGFYVPYLRGDFDGDGHQISNLFLNLPDGISNTGLFGVLSGSAICDLRLANVNVHGYGAAGGLAGGCFDGEILNCHVTGNVSGNADVGGVIGSCIGSTVSNCSSSVSVDASLVHAGGLIGLNSESEISNCFSCAFVEGGQRVGGLTGFSSWSTINNSYSTGQVLGGYEVGGLTAGNSDSTINNCYSCAVVQGTSHVGGLVGYTVGDVFNSYWDVERSGQTLSAGGSGRTTTEMTWPYSSNTYENWDFNDTWMIDSDHIINNGYPYLQIQVYVSNDDVSPSTDPVLSISVYPNPFNPNTTIEFDLPIPVEAQLTIYNLKGQRVRQLSSSYYGSGRHSIVWDGKDDNGSTLASATYLCRLVTGSQMVTSKLLLLK